MSLVNKVTIARRFQKSIRIDVDLGSQSALDGFICPQSSADILLSMARHVSETGQGAFTWTGPYGSGKSSLVIALSALLNGNKGLQQKAADVFGQQLTKAMHQALPTGSKGWRVLPVVGRRDNPVSVLGEALIDAGYVSQRPENGWTDELVVSVLTDVANSHPSAHGGLILFVDEMGKFLEAAAQDGSDVYVFQQLAEAASRSKGRLLFVGVLHQAFNEYAHRLTHELRDEWAKIQGRFVDLPVNTVGEEQIELISRAIECKHSSPESRDQSKAVANIARKDRAQDAKRLAEMLRHCWPLHPVVACLLGPISRRRFGQNQRSIFGFLNSVEPHGFREYLRHADDSDLYTPAQLWDYLRTNLEPSILASPDGHRWAVAAEALDRCEAKGSDVFLLELLKTIAVIDLFKERSSILPSFDLICTCFPEVPEKGLKDALATLDKWSLIIFKKFQGAYAVFAGSDFDIDKAVGIALDDIDALDFDVLKSLAGQHPILAKRHYHESGAMRWFDVNIVPAKDVIEVASRFRPKNGIIGEFLLAVPTEREDEEQVKMLCREAAKLSDDWDIVAGYSPHAWSMVVLARELLALNKLGDDHPELTGDPVARREVTARLADLQAQLEAELEKSFDKAKWCRKHYPVKAYRQAELNSLASELAEKRYEQSPKLHNELLNRQKPSSSAISGQNTLLRHMMTREGEVRLGIKGYPAEGGLYSSLLEATGLYSETTDGWRFVSPSNDSSDIFRLFPTWDAAIQYIKTHENRSVSVSELYELWAEQPFGIKAGLMPIIAVAFILSQRENLAIYRQGIFRSRFEDVDVEYMAKDASTIQLRWMDLNEVSRRMLSEMADVVRSLDENNKLVHLEPIDVARGLVAIYEQLPNWTKRTMRLSTRAIEVRDIFKRAQDPNKFLFNDIPSLVSTRVADTTGDDDLINVVSIIKEGLEELVQAYPLMLQRLRDMFLAELQVPNLSRQSLLELRDRAEYAKDLGGDFRLDAFVGRLAHFDAGNESFEGIASLAANKPPRDWVDPDMDRASIELVDMSQKFLRVETFTRIKGRPEKRRAMAVLIGVDGRPSPLLEEFEVIDSDRDAIDDLIERVSKTLDAADINSRSIILAALTELSARYMDASRAEKQKSGSEVA